MLKPTAPSDPSHPSPPPRALSPLQERIRKLDDFIVLTVDAAKAECPLSDALRQQLDALALASQAVRMASIASGSARLLMCLEGMDATAHQALHMARHMGRGLGELVGLLQVIANAARRLRKDAAMVSRGDEAVG